MKIKNAIGATLLGTSLLANAAPAPHKTNIYNDTKPVTDTTFNGKTPDQVCREVGNVSRMIMDKSERKLVACVGGKPALPEVLKATYNPKITPNGTYSINIFDEDKVNNHGVPMNYAMHVNLPHTKNNALWVHEGLIWMDSGKYRTSNGCIGIHYTFAEKLYNVMNASRESGKPVSITIKD